MTRFEQLVVSNSRDQYGIPRTTDVIIINTDEIATVEDLTVDLTYQAALRPDVPGGYYPTVLLTLKNSTQHTILIGHFANEEESDAALDQFTRWLTSAALTV